MGKLFILIEKMGEQLALENAVEADVIVPIPDSGAPAALGFSQTSGVPFELGIIRNHYIGRTFIEPSQTIRQFGVKLKHSVNPSVIKGKRVVLITIHWFVEPRPIVVRMMFDAGAVEVHLGISSPPFYIQILAGLIPQARMNYCIKSFVGRNDKDYWCNVTVFFEFDGTYKAMGGDARDAQTPAFTDHCFTGDYPVSVQELLKNGSGK